MVFPENVHIYERVMNMISYSTHSHCNTVLYKPHYNYLLAIYVKWSNMV